MAHFKGFSFFFFFYSYGLISIVFGPLFLSVKITLLQIAEIWKPSNIGEKKSDGTGNTGVYIICRNA